MHINAAEIELINTKSGEKEYVPINEEVIKQLNEKNAEIITWHYSGNTKE